MSGTTLVIFLSQQCALSMADWCIHGFFKFFFIIIITLNLNTKTPEGCLQLFLRGNPIITCSVRDDLCNTAIIKIYIPKSLSFLRTSVHLFLLAFRVNWVNWIDSEEECELRVFMVLSLCTIWLLWVEETQKSTQSSKERHRAEFIIVLETESLEGRPVKSFHVPFSRRVTVTCPQQADAVIPRGSDLSHILDRSYSTHCPISNVLRGLMSCHFCLSCPFQRLSFWSVTLLRPSFSSSPLTSSPLSLSPPRSLQPPSVHSYRRAGRRRKGCQTGRNHWRVAGQPTAVGGGRRLAGVPCGGPSVAAGHRCVLRCGGGRGAAQVEHSG